MLFAVAGCRLWTLPVLDRPRRSARVSGPDPHTLRSAVGFQSVGIAQGKCAQHGKPLSVDRDVQPEAREGQAGRSGVAEGLAVPLKPVNAGGGKGPQFKTDAGRSEGPGDWATYQLRRTFRNCRRRYTRKRRRNPATGFMLCTTRSAATT